MLRDHNEDDYRLPVDAGDASLSEKGYLYVLADGMGGHQKGEVASAVTVDAVPLEYYTRVVDLNGDNLEDVIVNALSDAIAKANVQVMEATQGGGTTIVSAVLHNDLLVMMNVGDSRAYLLRDGELRLMSRDHSLVSRLVEMGKITDEEALTHPRRNVLYQALGQGTDLEIHTVVERLQLNDKIVLCSDGLWGEISHDDFKEVLLTAESPDAAVQQLVDMANEAGGPDNITVIIIHTSDEKPPQNSLADTLPLDLPSMEDTHPSAIVQKPDTLPEGKFYTDKQ